MVRTAMRGCMVRAPADQSGRYVDTTVPDVLADRRLVLEVVRSGQRRTLRIASAPRVSGRRADYSTARPPSLRPSASVIDTKMPPNSPLFSGLTTTVTLSPGLMMFERQPFLAIDCGLPSSTPQRSTPPLAFGTSS